MGSIAEKTVRDDIASVDHRKVILVVDDIEADLLLFEKVFADNYSMIKALGASQAIKILRECSDISAVVIDLVMSDTEGIALLRMMKADKRLSQIPAIVVTASEDEESQIKAIENGAYDIIGKPFGAKILLHRVDSILKRREVDHHYGENKIFSEIIREADIDDKTGISNKQAFLRKTRVMLDNNPDKKYVLFRWDVDHFKVLNEIFGVEGGDKYLRTIGFEYRRRANPALMTYAHFSADHFVTCMEYDAFIRHNVSGCIYDFSAGMGTDFEFIARMGVYVIDDKSIDVTLMCDRAKLALMSIKNSYAVRVAYYDDSMRAALIEEQSLINDVKTALAENQFLIYFQPQYNYSKGELYGIEALARWNHPKKGMIMPADFIPLFESNGFISQLDQYIWDKTCALIRGWIDRGFHMVPVSVNISRKDLYNTKLCDIFSELLKKYKLDASMIRLEITESAYMDNPEQLIRVTEQLHEMGFCVQMDDFGSGYSSLNSLKDVPVDALKLDLKFLDGVKTDDRSGRIICSIVRMASWINLPVIAEGVEKKAQADYLKSIGCVYMQGYYFNKPMLPEDIENLLGKRGGKPVKEDESQVNIEGSADFLNASTQATLLFNSFVGGAQIIEYDGDKVESIRANDHYYDVIGTTREAYADKQLNLLKCFYPDSKETFINTLKSAAESGEERQCKLRSLPLSDSGCDIWTFNRIRFLARSGERYIYYMLVENITERVDLEQMRVRLTDIIRNVPAGIVIYELAEKIKTEYISDGVCRMYKYTPEEMREEFNRGILSMVHPDDRERVSKMANTAMHDMQQFSGQYRVRRSDGEYILVNIIGNPSIGTDGVLRFYCVLTDVSVQSGV